MNTKCALYPQNIIYRFIEDIIHNIPGKRKTFWSTFRYLQFEVFLIEYLRFIEFIKHVQQKWRGN